MVLVLAGCDALADASVEGGTWPATLTGAAPTAIVSKTCAPGYTSAGTPTRFCLASGVWAPMTAPCTRASAPVHLGERS
jgi:hypothetical protein